MSLLTFILGTNATCVNGCLVLFSVASYFLNLPKMGYIGKRKPTGRPSLTPGKCYVKYASGSLATY